MLLLRSDCVYHFFLTASDLSLVIYVSLHMRKEFHKTPWCESLLRSCIALLIHLSIYKWMIIDILIKYPHCIDGIVYFVLQVMKFVMIMVKSWCHMTRLWWTFCMMLDRVILIVVVRSRGLMIITLLSLWQTISAARNKAETWSSINVAGKAEIQSRP